MNTVYPTPNGVSTERLRLLMSRPSLLTAVGLMHNMVATVHECGQLRKKRLERAFAETNPCQERTEVVNTLDLGNGVTSLRLPTRHSDLFRISRFEFRLYKGVKEPPPLPPFPPVQT